MSGIDAINAIRKEFADARITLLTTYDGDVLAHRIEPAVAVRIAVLGIRLYFSGCGGMM